MPQPIIYIDRSKIRPGRLDELREAIAGLVEFIDAHEPQLLWYGFFVDPASSDMTVIAIHPDPASLELHMEIGGDRFRRFAELIELRAIEVYGTPSDKAYEQLRQKARMLGDGGSVTVTDLQAGFSRLPQGDGPHLRPAPTAE